MPHRLLPSRNKLHPSAQENMSSPSLVWKLLFSKVFKQGMGVGAVKVGGVIGEINSSPPFFLKFTTGISFLSVTYAIENEQTIIFTSTRRILSSTHNCWRERIGKLGPYHLTLFSELSIIFFRFFLIFLLRKAGLSYNFKQEAIICLGFISIQWKAEISYFLLYGQCSSRYFSNLSSTSTTPFHLETIWIKNIFEIWLGGLPQHHTEGFL